MVFDVKHKNTIGKKIASESDLALYSYVVDKAEEIVESIIKKVQRVPVDQGGSIFITGPVNSGKSIIACELSSRLKTEISNRNSVTIQPGVDRPDLVPDEIFSRAGITCPATSFSTKQEIETIFHKNEIVIVDEVQFIPYDLQSFFLKEATQFIERGGWLITIGLKYTSTQGEFILPSLICDRADERFFLKATCQMCGRKNATRNQRLINGKAASYKDDDLVSPSDKVSYEPRCEECLVI